ncbi:MULTISPECIES: hypothetical protein [Vibrio]|uniref:DUF3630 domain-containing protein n=1 Tax=Vibrio harveyi TaxID=669 RepID=A0ABN4L2M7_VIBHA|nr:MULTISPECIES: hypothetical protein [Vibrio]AMF98627.1 hypothetical protein AL538_13385 [Vibrio harveyi]EKO3833700.1 hypothetical protein [Vibrio harveyi]ELY1989779.1 hypothetical protein [Vibrio harveyi]MBY7702817.1 hypothetical protein [Vibrio harveyi]MDA0122616.1 hypothetical protein [Vibrio sp. MM46]
MHVNFYFEGTDVSFEELIGSPDFDIEMVNIPSVGDRLMYGNKICLVLERWWTIFQENTSEKALRECEILIKLEREI